MGPYGEPGGRRRRTPPPDAEAGLRFRLYVEGEIVAEDWLTPSNAETAEATAKRHGALADEAGDQGKAWLLEVYDPDDPDNPLRISPESFTAVRVTVSVIPPGFGRTYANPN